MTGMPLEAMTLEERRKFCRAEDECDCMKYPEPLRCYWMPCVDDPDGKIAERLMRKEPWRHYV